MSNRDMFLCTIAFCWVGKSHCHESFCSFPAQLIVTDSPEKLSSVLPLFLPLQLISTQWVYLRPCRLDQSITTFSHKLIWSLQTVLEFTLQTRGYQTCQSPLYAEDLGCHLISLVSLFFLINPKIPSSPGKTGKGRLDPLFEPFPTLENPSRLPVTDREGSNRNASAYPAGKFQREALGRQNPTS